MYWLTKLAQNKAVVIMAAVFIISVMLLPVLPVGAAEGDTFGMVYGAETGLGEKDVRVTITRIINVALGLLGVVAVVIILWGGFRWMTAGGNDEKTAEARKIIFAGIIGLAIILSAWAIAKFVLQQLGAATGAEGFEEV